MAKRIIVELRVPADFSPKDTAESELAKMPGFELDPEYEPVPVEPPEDLAVNLKSKGDKVFLFRGTIVEEKVDKLKALPGVLNVWNDARIEPFD